jgi:hypothetical protein
MNEADKELIAREFPDFDRSSLPEIPEGFICGAYHNDVCPLWYERETPEPGDIMLGVDYPAEDMRDHPGEDRFSVNLTQQNRTEDVLFTSDDWSEIVSIVRYVRMVRKFGLGFHPDTRGADYIMDDGSRCLTDDEAKAHDALVEQVCGITDPYDIGEQVWKALGLTD